MTHLDRFTCEQVFRRLDDFLDRNLGPEDIRRVEEHLARCAACASEFRFESQVIEGVREKLERIDMPEGLRRKISTLLADAEKSDEADG